MLFARLLFGPRHKILFARWLLGTRHKILFARWPFGTRHKILFARWLFGTRHKMLFARWLFESRHKNLFARCFWVISGGSKYQSYYFVVLLATQLYRSDPPSPYQTTRTAFRLHPPTHADRYQGGSKKKKTISCLFQQN